MPSSHGPRSGTRDKLSNRPRDSGTSPPHRQVESFEEGDSVHLAIDPSVPGAFHPKFNGRTGVVTGQQGDAYTVRVTDGNGEKTVISPPAHLTAQE